MEKNKLFLVFAIVLLIFVGCSSRHELDTSVTHTTQLTNISQSNHTEFTASPTNTKEELKSPTARPTYTQIPTQIPIPTLQYEAPEEILIDLIKTLKRDYGLR